RQELQAGLDQALGPAGLLRLERIHLNRKFGGTNNVPQIEKFPSDHLRAIAQVCIFSEGVVLPSTGSFDSLASPDSSSAVEVEEPARQMPAAMFENEVPIENYRLHLCQKRVLPIDVTPTHLHHSHLGIREIVDHILKEIGDGKEIGVEDCHKLAGGLLQSVFQGAGLEAAAVCAMDVADIETEAAVTSHAGGCDLVGGVR